MSNKLRNSVMGLAIAATLMFSVIWGTLNFNGNAPQPPTVNSSVVTTTR